ncbi:MAG: lysophospholipase [Bacteroidota bacterium]
MDVKEFSWKNPDGKQIYAVEWPVANARAVVGLIHGMGEHCRRYDPMVDWYRRHGIAFVGYDRQGFGRSEGQRAYAEGYKDYLDEVARLVVACEQRYPDTPLFLYGHSFGGQTLLQYLIKRNPQIDGAIVTGPHIRLGFKANPFIVALGRITDRVWPTFSQSNQLDVSLLSRTPEVISDYQQDPLNTDRLTSRVGIGLLDVAQELDTWRGQLPVPTLLMHGTADGITGAAGSEAFAVRNPENLTWKPWPGLYHEIHHEPEREEVFTYVLAWLEEKTGKGAIVPSSV